MDFTDTIHLRGQAEADLFFAELDQQLIKAMHERQRHGENIFKSVSPDDPHLLSAPHNTGVRTDSSQ